jgi:hypothetical protein
MPHIITYYLPEIDESERSFIESVTAGMSQDGIQPWPPTHK